MNMLAYAESTTSLSNKLLNKLRKHFIEIVCRDGELQKKTVTLNKELVELVAHDIVASSKEEAEKMYKEALASIISGATGIALSLAAFAKNIKDERTIAKNQRGINRINDIETEINGDKNGGGISGSPLTDEQKTLKATVEKGDFRAEKSKKFTAKARDFFKRPRDYEALEKQDDFDTPKNYVDPDTDADIATLAKSNPGTKSILSNRKKEYEVEVDTKVREISSTGAFVGALTTATGQVSNALGSMAAIENVEHKGIYDAGANVGNNMIDQNKDSIRTTQERSNKFFELALNIDNTMEKLNDVNVIRG